MRILYLQQQLAMPGARGNPRCWQMAKHFVSVGHEVTFITSLTNSVRSSSKGELSDKIPHQTITSEGITVHAISVPSGHMLSFPRRIISWLQFYRKAWRLAIRFDPKEFDIIIGYTPPLTMPALGQRLAKRFGIPFCMEVADVWPDVPIGMGVVKNRVLVRLLHARTKHVYEKASMIFPYTEGMNDQILSHGDYSSKTHVLHNGVDCKIVKTYDRTKRPGPIKVIYAGTIGIAYDLTQLVRAIKIIEESGRLDLDFCVVGKGNDEVKVKELAHSIGVKTLRFFPPIGHEEIPDLLNQADIGISCMGAHAVLEANGATKYFDYLAAGLPMVCNYEGWQSEYMEKYSCGLFSPRGDDEAFAANILKLADSPALRQKFAVNGRELAERVFDRNKIAVKYTELLEECARQ